MAPDEETPGFLRQTVDLLNQFGGLDQRDKDNVLESALGIAQGISNLTQRDRAGRTVVDERKTYSFDTDLSVDSFDYNIFGTTKEQVFGSMFGTTRFPNPGSRLANLRANYQ